jgi:hypothetical protein
VGPIEVGLPLQILLLLRKSRLIILQLSSGNVDPRLKVARIDLEEQVALPDWLIVSDGNLYNRTRDSRCDADDVGTDLAISGPGIFDITRIKGDGRPDSQANNC